MKLIITRRQRGVLIEATCIPEMLTMLRSQFLDEPNQQIVESHWHYPDTPHGNDNLLRHWQSLSSEMADEVRRSKTVSCRIDSLSPNNPPEYILGQDMEPLLTILVEDNGAMIESDPF